MPGCSVGPSYKAPAVVVPTTWKNHQCAETAPEETLTCSDRWWDIFHDEKLNELENLALANNQDLLLTLEKIKEARARIGIAAADFYPQITLNPLFTNTDELTKNYSRLNSIIQTKDAFRVHELLYFLPVNMNYEVDLWGKIRDRYKSTVYDFLAQKKDYETVMLSLTTQLAGTYYQLRAADNQLALLQKVIESRQKAFDINKARFDDQITDYVDVTLAGEEIDSAITQFQEVKRQREILENELALLIGVPASDFVMNFSPFEGAPPVIPEGIPSEILLRRPDIAEAEFTTRSNHALIKEAYTGFFPSINLTATAGYESPLLKYFLLGISRFWMDGVQIDQFIFDGGKTCSNLKLQIARFKESEAAYQQQVLIAFREVEDALSDINRYSKEYAAMLATTRWAAKSYALYVDRYDSGITNYINVVNTERDLLNYQITLNNIQGFRYIATIQLIKALGGGWSL